MGELAQYEFDSREADYPGLASVPVLLRFPRPFTLGDWKTWKRTIRPSDDESKRDDVDELALMREYRGVLAVATLEDAPPDPPAIPREIPEEDAAGFSRVDLDADDDELPLAFVSWVTDCAEECFGRQVLVEQLQTTLIRWHQDRYMGARFETVAYLPLLPDLVGYKGHVVFHDPLTKGAYREWVKGRRVLNKVDPRDVDNSPFIRGFRGAVSLVKEWEVEGVDFKRVVKRNDGEGVPLVVASWLVECAGRFLARRISVKKMLVA